METFAPGAEDMQLEGMKVVSAELGVCVHPAWANNVQQGVREILNSLLFRYNEELDGVVLAYLDLKIPSHMAKILQGLSPHFKVNLTAKLLLFSPKVGMMLEGKVNKIEKDYIGVLVLGLFNAAIGVSDIRDEFYFSEEEHPLERAWVSNLDQQHVIKFGTVIRFSVKSVQEKEEFLDIAGSLEPTSTGSVDWLAQLEKDKLRKEHKERHKERRKRHRKELEVEGNVWEGMNLEDGYKKERHHMPKKKKYSEF